MEIITIKIKNAETKQLMNDLQALNLIEIIKESAVKEDGKNLSELLKGSLTKQQSEQMQKELLQMRNEWNRNI